MISSTFGMKEADLLYSPNHQIFQDHILGHVRETLTTTQL
jgi:hypothetical protein